MRSEHIEWAYLVKEIPPHAKKRVVRRGNRAKGVTYEKKVQKHLKSLEPVNYLPSPWIRYKRKDGSLRWCQPDGLLFNTLQGIITIIEVKLSHTSNTYDQVWNLYAPVLEIIFPPDLWQIRGLEVVKWYDPHAYFPGRHHLRENIHSVQRNETGVFIWNPRR